jgi:hypothetical protein
MDVVRTLLKSSLPQTLRGLSVEDRLSAAWVIICGRAMANQSSISDYDGGVVRIEVRDRTWLEQMRSMSAQLEKDLGRIAGVKISTLHFVVKEDLTER